MKNPSASLGSLKVTDSLKPVEKVWLGWSAGVWK
jgi:hypothetical protein